MSFQNIQFSNMKPESEELWLHLCNLSSTLKETAIVHGNYLTILQGCSQSPCFGSLLIPKKTPGVWKMHSKWRTGNVVGRVLEPQGGTSIHLSVSVEGVITFHRWKLPCWALFKERKLSALLHFNSIKKNLTDKWQISHTSTVTLADSTCLYF